MKGKIYFQYDTYLSLSNRGKYCVKNVSVEEPGPAKLS